MPEDLKGIIGEQSDNIKSIGNPLIQIYERIKKDYSNLLSAFPELKKPMIDDLINGLSGKSTELKEQALNLLSKLNIYSNLLIGLKENYDNLMKESELLLSDKGKLRIIINPTYLKPVKGEAKALEVQLSSEDDFRTLIEPKLANIITRSSLFNSLGDYLEKTYGSRDLNVVLESNKDKQLPTVKYENGQVVKFTSKVEEGEPIKALRKTLALEQYDSMMSTYANNKASLDKEYPLIKDELGIGFAMSMEPLLSKLNNSQIKLNDNNLKADERKDLLNEIDNLKSEIGLRVSNILKKYPKLAELMKNGKL